MPHLTVNYKSTRIVKSSMYSNELVKAAKQLKLENFIGVFPLNRLPTSLKPYAKPLCFIVNTDTMNLPGQHWIAVSYSKCGIAYAFDPLGMFYPHILTSYLTKRARRVIFKHCLHWLKSMNTR